MKQNDVELIAYMLLREHPRMGGNGTPTDWERSLAKEIIRTLDRGMEKACKIALDHAQACKKNGLPAQYNAAKAIANKIGKLLNEK